MEKDKSLIDLATKPLGRLLWDYSMPAIVGMVVMQLYHIIDRIYIGRGLGPEAISGLTITFPVMNLSAAFGVLIGAGASARTSIMLGADNRQGAERVLGNALVLTLVIGTVYVAAFGVFIDPILRAFGASDVTLPYARDFMLWILPGMIVMNLCFSFNNVMRASGYPVRAMVTMIIGAGLNVALAPLFVFVFGMGIKGAAIATDISMAISAAFVMWHFMRPASRVHFRPGIYKLERGIVMGIIAIGAAPSLVNAASCIINMIVNQALVHYGTDLDVGAAGIFITYTSLLTMLVVGLGMGMQPIVGYNYGAGRFDRLRRVYWMSVAWGTVVVTAGCLFGLLFPRLIALIFTDDARLLDVTENGLRHALVCFWVVGFQIISTSFFQSIGKAAQSIVLSLSRQVLFMCPLLLWLPRTFGINGVWLSFPTSDVLATVVTALMVWWQLREIKKATQNVNPLRN